MNAVILQNIQLRFSFFYHFCKKKKSADSIELKLTVLGDGCRRRLQHVLREVNEDLVELATAQQVEVLNNLPGNTSVSTLRFAICMI